LLLNVKAGQGWVSPPAALQGGYGAAIAAERAATVVRQIIRAGRRFLLAAALLAVAVAAASPIVPAYMSAQSDQIAASATRHNLPPSWVAAVLYNEMLGTEDRIARQLIPGDGPASVLARQGLLGLDLVTVKQLHWGAKTLLALLGGNPTLGPAGIRVTVGREIRAEVSLEGGAYAGDGWAERASMILDLVSASTSIEYLAGNLERGQARLALPDRGDWGASARWHNTGVVYDSAIVRRADWDKGNRYVAQVKGFLPQVAPLLSALAPGGAAPAATTSQPGAPVALASRDGLLTRAKGLSLQ
jgi:hypothetical protein